MRTATAPIAVLFAACSHHAPPAGGAPPPTAVSVVAVTARDIPRDFEYLGLTEGSREVEVRARIQGYLDSRHFTEGAMVKAGDLLFVIDPKPLLAQEVWAKAELAVAEAREEQTAREAKRLEPLVADEAVTRKEHDDAVSAELIAKAALASAQAKLAQIQLDLSYTRVTAPIAGKIGRALRPEGSLVEPGDKGLLTTLLRLDPIYVSFQRSENQQFDIDRDLAGGRLALPDGGSLAVEIRYRDGTLLLGGGTLDYTDGRLDTTTGTIPMRATVPNPDLRLRAGQAVVVVLRGAVLKNALAVPQRAVIESPQGKSVWVAVQRDGKTVFESRPIEVGEWVDLPGDGPQAHAWVVKKGLAAGDRVIVDNLVRIGTLPPGSPLQIVDAAAPAAADGKGTDGGTDGKGTGGKGN
jgi:membrane fusion protein (multidrug efflux system)